MAFTTTSDLEPLPGLSLFSGEEQQALLASCQAAAPSEKVDKLQLLTSYQAPTQPSYIPLATISLLLSRLPGSWPVSELLQAYSRLWRHLPEEAKAGRSEHQVWLDHLIEQLKQSYGSLIELFPSHNTPALRDASSRILTHKVLHQFVEDFRLPVTSSAGTFRPVVAIGLANGPILGLAVLAVSTYYTAAPVIAASGAEQFRSDVLQGGSKIIMASPNDVTRLGLKDAWVTDNKITVVLCQPQDDLTFTMTSIDGQPLNPTEPRDTNGPDDAGIMLFTSGTSGTKKLVPLPVHNIVSGVAMVQESWGLTADDICLNQMPLNHVGGIVRNLFAPVMAGGSTVCCSGFDPNLFWDVVEEQNPTWYYASPTMHNMILEASQTRPDALAKCQMRLICNAAGGLLPSLAIQLRDTFNCTVLPSYGMTECMPISTPPLDYKLDRSGTSGVTVGPEIAILDGNDKPAPAGEVGNISVRGAPVFPGYLKNGVIDKSAFNKDGWFNTGDMGFLDEDGFLYITGRSKEVINRGGELISPFEVEEAIMTAAKKEGSPIYGQVSQALAFSAIHDVLQEVVGIAIVTPSGAKRADLRKIQEAVKSSLQQVKWPVTVVYMEDVPKNNNKVLRIKLGERLDLPELSDSVPMAYRHYEAVCPPPNSALSVKIQSEQCRIDYHWLASQVEEHLDGQLTIHVRPDSNDCYPEVIIAPSVGSNTAGMDVSFVESLEERLRQSLDALYVPSRVRLLDEPLPMTDKNFINEDLLDELLRNAAGSGDFVSDNEIEVTVAGIIADVIGIPASTLTSESDFFDVGGDSLRAGKLLSLLRKEFGVKLPIDLLFTSPRLGSLAAVINEKLGGNPPPKKNADGNNGVVLLDRPLPGCYETRSSTNPFLMIAQLIPLMIVYPMKRALTWTVFMFLLSNADTWPTAENIYGRLFNLVASLIVGRLVTAFVAPIVAICFKWLVIGKYREGMYPMWGGYHTRWWLTQKVIAIGGMGHFSYFNWSRVLYYRLLGACLGGNVTINPGVTLGEYDLLEIGNGTTLDRCICRPFAAERNTTMYLGRIHIGRNCHIGASSIIAPGSVLSDDTCIGLNSSSWEKEDATEANRDLSANKTPAPHWLLTCLLTYPLLILTRFIGALPWMFALYGLVDKRPSQTGDRLISILDWFAAPHRIGFHYAGLIANVSVGPVVLFGVVALLRWIFDKLFGAIRPSAVHNRSGFMKWRMASIKRLMSLRAFHKFVDLFGVHYEMTSIAVRAMGGRAGKRIYWPGTGPGIGDFGLLDVGNDVVFGSRAHLITSDGNGSDYIKIGNGAMVADRVALLPGSSLGEHTVFGSGALGRRDKAYPANSTWVGSKGGEAINLSAPVVEGQDEKRPGPKRHVSSGSQDSDDSNGYDARTLRESIMPTSGYSTTLHSVVPSALPSARNSIDGRSLAPPVPELPGRGRRYSSQGSFMSSPYADASNNEKQPRNPSVDEGSVLDGQVKDVFGEDDLVAEASTPFGRAFYQRKAPYYVLPSWLIFLYSTFIIIFVAFYWNVPTVSAVQIVARLVGGKWHNHVLANDNPWRPVALYAIFASFIAVLMSIQAVFAVAIVIAAKWMLMGRRRQGSYDWDKSSYCQRWQVFLAVEKLRRYCYGGFGIFGMLTGTHYVVWYMRALGANIGKDCALFAGGLPSLMFTEPDLLTLGDRVSVDDASLVGHINSRGNFNLNPLSVGHRSVLRSGSRLLSGATMGDDTCLLEHTLIMAGDVVPDGETRQGWPAEEFEGNRCPTMQPIPMVKWVMDK